MAIPLSTYDSFFQLPFVQATIQQHQLKLAVYEPEAEEIVKWQN
ncbi:element excision factor XisH family protein [Chamaesiphon sp. OTE_20_metabat_361]|nr:element excision factor XisH family protein [Chamaesiphon sp. OTE_20_metabat_361]